MPDPDAIAMSNEQPAVTGPALSASTDMPAVTEEITTEDAESNEQQEAAVEATTEEATESEPEKPAKKANRPTVAEVAKAREARRQAEARAAEADRRAQAAEARLAELTKPATPQMPKREDFSDPDEYATALVEFGRKQGEESTETKLTAKQKHDAQVSMVRESKAAFDVACHEFAESHPDFDEVFHDDLPVTDTMAGALLFLQRTTGTASEVAYRLGENDGAEADRISKLPPDRQLEEMHKLSFQLARAAASPPPSSPRIPKPAPIKPVGQRASSSDVDVGDLPMAEYAARRTAEIQAARRGNGRATTH